jgi:hypothetical protein
VALHDWPGAYNYGRDAAARSAPHRLDWNRSVVAISEHHVALAGVVGIFKSAGFYAYRTLDDENRWCVACDVDEGHIDVRIGADGYELDVWATSPGMFLDEENERRQQALERLARISLPGLRRGYLEEHQSIEWRDDERGIALRTSFAVPFSADTRLPDIASEQLQELNRALRFLERKLLD